MSHVHFFPSKLGFGLSCFASRHPGDAYRFVMDPPLETDAGAKETCRC
jgi:hypothetical protein